MKEWVVEYGFHRIFVYADDYEGAVKAAYETIGYDPDDELFIYCEEDES